LRTVPPPASREEPGDEHASTVSRLRRRNSRQCELGGPEVGRKVLWLVHIRRGIVVGVLGKVDGARGAVECVRRADQNAEPARVEFPQGACTFWAYYLSPTHPELVAVLNRLQDSRAARASKIVERLRNLGLEITLAEITDLAGGQVGRAHIAQALVNRGYVPSASEAFTRYLRRERPGYVDRVRLPPRR